MTDKPDLAALLHEALNEDQMCVHSPENEWQPLCEEYAANVRVGDADSIDAAWAEAEAALPEGWELDLSRWADGACGVVASLRVDGLTSRVFKVVDPFPAAALRAVAAKLRGQVETT